MKLWIAREQNGKISIHDMEPEIDTFELYGKIVKFWDSPYRTELDFDLFPEITFENSPQEVEIKIPTTKPLTRDYFSNHNWEIVIHEPDGNGFILWEAKWKRSMEEGSPYYSDLTVTNMMYEDRFCISGKTSKGNVGYLMAYTEEDLINILKVFAIHGFYEQESKKVELKLINQ